MTAHVVSNTNLLKCICDTKRSYIVRQQSLIPRDTIRRQADAAPSVRPFIKTLMHHRVHGRYSLIAEIKKASPSQGVIRRHFDAAALARCYAQAGATCLSIVTDKAYFQGADRDLVTARAACDLAVLRKDFLLDDYQILESRALGADCILLILAVLDDTTAGHLVTCAADYGMDVLVEVHNDHELERALALPVRLIGINNRNLDSLTVDLAITERLAAAVPQDRLVVSESGLNTLADLERMASVGVTCFLVGHSLLQQEDVTKAVQNLLGYPENLQEENKETTSPLYQGYTHDPL